MPDPLDLAADALARRCLAAEAWRWLPGMVNVPRPGYTPFRVHETRMDDRFDPPAQVVSRGSGFTLASNLGPPDLTDPATLGCLLALVRERFGENACINYNGGEDGPEWYVVAPGGRDIVGPCPTEVEALIVALETPRD